MEMLKQAMHIYIFHAQYRSRPIPQKLEEELIQEFAPAPAMMHTDIKLCLN